MFTLRARKWPGNAERQFELIFERCELRKRPKSDCSKTVFIASCVSIPVNLTADFGFKVTALRPTSHRVRIYPCR